MPIRTPDGYLDITNATLRGSEIITTSNVGIANSAPTHTLSVGNKLFVDDSAANVLTVSGNLVATSLKIGQIDLAPSYGLEHVANVGNTISSVVQFTNTGTGFVSASNVGIGTTTTPAGLLDVVGSFRMRFQDMGVTKAHIITGGNSASISESGGVYTYTRGGSGNTGNFLPNPSNIVPKVGQRYRVKLTARSDYAGTIRYECPTSTIITTYDLTASFKEYTWDFTATGTTMQFAVTTASGTTSQFNAFSIERLGVGFNVNPTSTTAPLQFSGVTHFSDWVGIGTDVPIGKLDVRGAIIAPVIPFSSNQDAAYLVASTPAYTGDPGNTGNWNLHGFEHRIKVNGSGVPRITVDDGNGNEVFTVVNGGNVGIGTVSPRGKLDIYTGATSTAGLIIDRYPSGTYRSELYQESDGLAIKVGDGSNAPAENMRITRTNVMIPGKVALGTSTASASQFYISAPGNGSSTSSGDLHVNNAGGMTLYGTRPWITTTNGQGHTGKMCAINLHASGHQPAIEWIRDVSQGTNQKNWLMRQETDEALYTWYYNGTAWSVPMYVKSNAVVAQVNVGIGTATPHTPFHTQSNAGADDTWVDQWKHSFDTNWNFRLSHKHDVGVNVEIGFKQRYNSTEYAPITFRGPTMELSGNVGIGTATPQNKLDVRSDHYATFGKATYNAAGWSGIRLGTPYTSNHDAYCSVIESYNNHAADYNSTLRFKTSNGNNAAATERVQIDTNGLRVFNGGDSYVWVQGSGSIYRDYGTPAQYGGGIHLTNNAVLPATRTGGTSNGGTDLGGGSYLWARVFGKIGFFLDDYYQSTGSQWFGKRYNNTDMCLGGMEIENLAITSGANYSQRIHIRTHRHGVSHGRRMTIHEDGNVGIGTETPAAKLHVHGVATPNIGNSDRRYFNRNTNMQTQWGSWPWGVSILASGTIVTMDWFVATIGTIGASDERIKKDIVDIDDGEALNTLRLLKPKQYKYKDTSRGLEPVWGFIAQEVKETLPYATQIRTECIPNIYEHANVSESNVITFTNFNTYNLESNVSTIKVYDKNDKQELVTIDKVIDAHSIRVKEDLTNFSGSIDAEGNVISEITTTTITPEEYEALEEENKFDCVANISGYQNANVIISVEEYNALDDISAQDYEQVIQDYTKTITTYPGNQLFVYGQQVDDFVFLKKESIFTVATAALQEVDRQLQAEKTKTTTLETKVTTLETKTAALETELQTETAALETKLQEAEAKITTLQAEKEAMRSDLSSLVLRVTALES